MFGQSYVPSKPDKLPTFNQWVKTLKKNEYPGNCHVSIIWVPGKFDNYTLQTGKFRLIVTPKDALFDHVKEYLSQETNLVTGISIKLTDPTEPEYEITQSRHRGRYIPFYGANWIWESPSKDK